MVLVKRTLAGIHVLVVLPCFGDHHEQGVRKSATPKMQQLEYFVKACAVAHAVGDDWKSTIEPRNDTALEKRFSRAHPVAVALHRVDLTVVCDVAIRMCKWPRRERVRTETAVDQRQC